MEEGKRTVKKKKVIDFYIVLVKFNAYSKNYKNYVKK